MQKIDERVNKGNLDAGVPQGFVLGPLKILK